MATKLRTRTQPFIDIPLVDSEAAGALGETGLMVGLIRILGSLRWGNDARHDPRCHAGIK